MTNKNAHTIRKSRCKTCTYNKAQKATLSTRERNSRPYLANVASVVSVLAMLCPSLGKPLLTVSPNAVLIAPILPFQEN